MKRGFVFFLENQPAQKLYMPERIRKKSLQPHF